MKICLVTTFPPSTGGLSEYGFHIARELQRNPFLNLTVLADQLSSNEPELEGFTVLRCWSFDDPGSVIRLMKTLRTLRPDVVWFNLLFSTFGRNPFVAFSGLLTPLLARLSGRYTHVTLHHLMDTVELKDAGIRHEQLYRIAGTVATKMLLLSDSVSVLMPGYRQILNNKYGRDNVHLRAHGILTRRPELPDFSMRGKPHRILAFGKWGTYKRLELMIEAFRILAEKSPETRLVVAGGDHPQAQGYTELMKKLCAEDPSIEFRGYIPEEELRDLFQSCSVAVMPYSSSTGCSGVAHLACAYGVPIVCADLPDFRQMAQDEELAIEFHPPASAEGLAECLLSLLGNENKQRDMATQNFAAALRMTMPNVVQKYLRHFELQQRVQTLRHVSRVRRLPRWVPSKSLILRLMTRNSLAWTRRSSVIDHPSNGFSHLNSLNRNRDGGGDLGVSSVPVHGDNVVARPRRGGSIDRTDRTSAARRTSNDQDGGNTDRQNRPDPLVIPLPDQRQAKKTDAQSAGGKEKAALFVAGGSDGARDHSQLGAGPTRTGSDG